jgi:glutathione S-transferase
MIKLYGVPASRAFRPRWVLEELGLEYQNLPVHFATGETRSAEFRKLNPNGHIPVLVDNETVLWESIAINLYLARKYGAGALWPTTVEDEGRAFQWSCWVMTEVEAPLLAVLLHGRLLPEAQRDPAKAAEGRTTLAGPLGVLDGALRGKSYLLGNVFTIADLNVASVLTWALLAKLDLGPYPTLAAWLQRCTERSAHTKARS